jgi:hypothetical protein
VELVVDKLAHWDRSFLCPLFHINTFPTTAPPSIMYHVGGMDNLKIYSLQPSHQMSSFIISVEFMGIFKLVFGEMVLNK